MMGYPAPETDWSVSSIAAMIWVKLAGDKISDPGNHKFGSFSPSDVGPAYTHLWTQPTFSKPDGAPSTATQALEPWFDVCLQQSYGPPDAQVLLFMMQRKRLHPEMAAQAAQLDTARQKNGGAGA